MRFVDFHTHPYRPGDLAPGTWEFVRRVSRAVREYGDRLADPRFVADLLRAQGAERAVVLAEHCPESSGNVRTETVLDICRQVPDFFLPFASVDPNTDPEPASLLRRYLDDGAVGLKLYPSYQFFYPNERRVYPLYELAQERGIPVLFHIGSSVLPNTRLKFCDPIHLDDLAVDFPDLVVVMAHGGRGFWYDACAFLAAHHPNFYIDVTGLVPSRLLEHFPDLARLADKVVFGSDWPAMPRSPGENARAIASLPLPPDAVEKILRGNAIRLLRLHSAPAAPAPDRGA
ncbi:MAG TPA: amidohydrolase family protein [Longimicrobiales bacterium]|nr:amidohydrolase family protein [Longimicrobiales bacterium]